MPKQNKIDTMNTYGLKVIDYYTQIFQVLIDDKETEKNSNYYQSVISSKFNVAKAYSKVYL